jgi:1,4-alpha-glucan branching enzyme
MKKIYSLIFALGMTVLRALAADAIDPTISPTFFTATTTITVTYNVSGTVLENLTSAYAWVWIPGKNINAKYNINPASSNASTNSVKFTKSVIDGETFFTLTFKPSDLFDASITTETAFGILLKGNDWTDGQTTDYLAYFWNGAYDLRLLSPANDPIFVDQGEQVEIKAEAPVASTFELYIDDVLTQTVSGTNLFTYTHTVANTSGGSEVEIRSNAAQDEKVVRFRYLISASGPNIPRPAGIIDGINYDPADPTRVTLSVWAPNNTSAYAYGDFTGWEILPEYLMNKDGEHFWIEIDGLTPGQEYGFQYLIDEFIKIADPYADKILSTDDQYIPTSTYPSLKPYPAGALTNAWYFNRVAVFQTNQTPFNWTIADFSPPKTEDLVVYELLVRDFFGDGERNYQNLIDTISYFKRLGVNAIELMPIMEFSGNDSWGYNPNFMFAPDKYYGTKDKLKEFIDVCHQNGIAVILDIAMNHQDIPNPYLLMDFNYSTFKPNPTNPWFNVTATHPFSVFYDMNHESLHTKKYLDTINYYWLNEYKVDGFRFDLSKGFTQTNHPNDVNAWSAKDDSRIAILKRMSDEIRAHTPDAILILEHLADNAEEKILAEYGFLMWGVMNYAYSQLSMGYSSGSNISGTSHLQRGWTQPNLIAYMESHDEERMMYRNLNFGNANATYSVKNINTALERVKAASIFYYAIPGPKMLWQFGELGYDISIEENGRTGIKPLKWSYYNDVWRMKLFNTASAMIKMKQEYDVFETDDVTLTNTESLLKQLTLKNNPYNPTPASAVDMNVHIIGNFDIIVKTITATFPHAGNWFHYFSDGELLNISTSTVTIELQPGEVRLYTDVQLQSPQMELIQYVTPIAPELTSVSENASKVALTWVDNSLIETGYDIYRRKGGEPFVLVGQASSGSVSYNDSKTLEPLTDYDYFVAAKNLVSFSTSDTLSITTSQNIVGLENNLRKAIELHPNPVEDLLRIASQVRIVNLRLYSTQGILQNIRRNGSENIWDVKRLSSGIYIANIETPDGSIKVKVIKK